MPDNTRRRLVGTRKKLADGTIRVTVSHGYRADGQQRRISAVARDEDEAERLALELAAQLGRKPDLGRGVTLRRWWDAYVAGKGARLTRATLARYTQDMERVWLPAMGDVDISLVSRAKVQEVLLSLGTRSKASHAKSALSAVLTQAVRDGHLSENPIRAGGFEMPGDVGATSMNGFDDGMDPFAAIEDTSDVWDARTVLSAMPLLRGVPIETCWLCMVGAGLRREEALALTWRDVRRIEVGGRMVTQLAVYKALTVEDGLKQAKTRRSVRVVSVVEPFGARLWELREDPGEQVCKVSASNIHHRWKVLFEPVTSKHAMTVGRNKGKLAGMRYVPLNRMRATHETYMQQAGVLDSVNAAAHGHSERVSYMHYQRPDTIGAAEQAGRFLLLEGGETAETA